MTFLWDKYYYTNSCILSWKLAFQADEGTDVEDIREWGDEEDILIKHGGSDSGMKKFAQ